ncbi:MAG: hypothetical protein GY797_01135 [Deltaproteobacteria bacterium]|nr:hypothetical protein [Deltaproteobacteria bacterium]
MVKAKKIFFLFYVFFVTLSLQAYATTTIENISLSPTFSCIGIRSTFSGDENQNISALLEYRKVGESNWKKGAKLYIDRLDSILEYTNPTTNPYVNQARASILGLDRNSEYEVRITYTDPDGVSGTNPISGTVTTWSHDQPISSGNTYYVATTGSNGYDGSEGTPWETLQYAVDNIAPGDTILIKSGNYIGFTTNVSGFVNNYITIKSYDLGNPAIIASQTILKSDYVHIKNLKFQGGLRISSAQFNIIEDNEISIIGLQIRSGNVTGTLIQNNYIHDTSENNDIQLATCIYIRESVYGSVVIRNNTIRNGYDGIGGERNVTIIAGFEDSDIYNNDISFCLDDGIESEGGNINNRIWDNKLKNITRNALATNPVIVGPVYVFRNVAYNSDSGLKIGKGTGKGYYYHNVFYNNTSDAIHDTDSPAAENLEFKNNVFHGTKYTLEVGGIGHILDYNNHDTTASARLKWRFHTADTVERYDTLDLFRAIYTEHEPNGKAISSLFVDSSNGDFALQLSSPLIDQGIILYGFNDENSPWPYEGEAPDIGAVELKDGALSPPRNVHIMP